MRCRPEDQLKAYYHAHMLRKHCCEVDARDMKMDDQLQFIKETFSGNKRNVKVRIRSECWF